MNGTKPAWHYWLVAVVSVLWNLMGAYDYWMTRTRNMAWLDQATQGHGEIFLKWHDQTGWLVQIGWPLGVWGSLAGAVLLLARSRHAVSAYTLSLVGALASYAAQLTGSFPPEIHRQGMAVAAVAITALIAAQLWYARNAADRGLLR
jgi:hypothetical protein